MSDRDLFPDDFPAIPLDEVDLAPLLPGSSGQQTYERLVAAAFSSALMVLIAKIGAVLLISSFAGATITVQFFLKVLPYFGIIAEPRDFATIVTFSTIAMITVGLGMLVRPVLQVGWDRQVVWGRAVGLAIAAETFLLEAIRHLLWPDVVRWDWGWLSGFLLVLGVVLLIATLKQTNSVSDSVRRAYPAHHKDTEEYR